MKKKLFTAILIVIAISLFGGYLYANNTSKSTVTGNIITLQQADAPKKTKECPNMFISWNLKDFGKKKTDDSIERIADIVCTNANIIAVQEVVAGKQFGAQTVARLAAACSRKGRNWDYIVSDEAARGSFDVERYAYLFEKSIVSTDRNTAHLIQNGWLHDYGREPYTITFKLKQRDIVTVTTLHAPPTAKYPITTIEALIQLEELKGSGRAIFSGDFNLGKDATDPSFAKLGFTGHINEPTSLKNNVIAGKYREKQYDNIYTRGIHVCSSGVINFAEKYYSPVTTESIKEAKKVSDHLPVFVTFE